MKIIISLLNGFNVIFRKYDYSNENESFTSSSDITQNVEIENETKYGKQSYKIKNLDDYTGVFVYIVNNSRRRFLQNSDEKKIMLKYNSYPSEEEIILNQFNINDDTIIAEKDDNDNVIVKINPIINSNSNQTLTNTSLYILNIYNKEDVESEDNLNSIYSEETIKNSYNNGTYTNNKIQFIIPNTTLSEKDYYIQIKAEINEEGEILIYKTLAYSHKITNSMIQNITLSGESYKIQQSPNNNFYYHRITFTNTLVFDLIKIKIDSQYNGYVYATVSNTYPYSTSYGQHKFLKNNPLIYFSRSIIQNRQVYLGIYCETNECKYDLEIQAINLTDIQMYDNRNFILSSTYDKNATITYNTDITDLNTNNILISILGTAVMDVEMDVKYNNIDVKSYKNLPNGRTIILSSKSISSFSNSTPIKIDLNVPDNENITIINRIIPINNNNNSINNINIYDEITSFIGDNSFIKQECFKINDDVNDNNMIIYGYSSNGIYAFQARGYI